MTSKSVGVRLRDDLAVLVADNRIDPDKVDTGPKNGRLLGPTRGRGLRRVAVLTLLLLRNQMEAERCRRDHRGNLLMLIDARRNLAIPNLRRIRRNCGSTLGSALKPLSSVLLDYFCRDRGGDRGGDGGFLRWICYVGSDPAARAA